MLISALTVSSQRLWKSSICTTKNQNCTRFSNVRSNYGFRAIDVSANEENLGVCDIFFNSSQIKIVAESKNILISFDTISTHSKIETTTGMNVAITYSVESSVMFRLPYSSNRNLEIYIQHAFLRLSKPRKFSIPQEPVLLNDAKSEEIEPMTNVFKEKLVPGKVHALCEMNGPTLQSSPPGLSSAPSDTFDNLKSDDTICLSLGNPTTFESKSTCSDPSTHSNADPTQTGHEEINLASRNQLNSSKLAFNRSLMNDMAMLGNRIIDIMDFSEETARKEVEKCKDIFETKENEALNQIISRM